MTLELEFKVLRHFNRSNGFDLHLLIEIRSKLSENSSKQDTPCLT